MHTITIIREHIAFGPYDERCALQYFSDGKILLNDLVRIDCGTEEIPFAAAAIRCGWKLPSPVPPWEVVKKIGPDFLIPLGAARWGELFKRVQVRLIVIAGLAPLAVLLFNFTFAIYLLLAVYVSGLWGVFFWAQFKTETSSVKQGVTCFCVTALLSTTLLVLLHATGLLRSIDRLTESAAVLARLIGYLCCAGLPEEICKAAVVWWLVRRPGKVLKPQDVVLYGLLSGLGFGIHEGLGYQLGVNRALNDVDATYVCNVLRLTSLPFLHACWCGIASYFIAYAAIVPMCRHGLWLLAMLIPATIHAVYDTFCGSVLGLAAAGVSVVLMMAYLSGAKNLRRKLL